MTNDRMYPYQKCNNNNADIHNYKLQPRPMEPRQQFNLTHIVRQYAYMIHPKPQAHIVMMHMTDKAEIEKLGKKGNEHYYKCCTNCSHERHYYQKENNICHKKTKNGVTFS